MLLTLIPVSPRVRRAKCHARQMGNWDDRSKADERKVWGNTETETEAETSAKIGVGLGYTAVSAMVEEGLGEG